MSYIKKNLIKLNIFLKKRIFVYEALKAFVIGCVGWKVYDVMFLDPWWDGHATFISRTGTLEIPVRLYYWIVFLQVIWYSYLKDTFIDTNLRKFYEKFKPPIQFLLSLIVGYLWGYMYGFMHDPFIDGGCSLVNERMPFYIGTISEVMFWSCFLYVMYVYLLEEMGKRGPDNMDYRIKRKLNEYVEKYVEKPVQKAHSRVEEKKLFYQEKLKKFLRRNKFIKEYAKWVVPAFVLGTAYRASWDIEWTKPKFAFKPIIFKNDNPLYWKAAYDEVVNMYIFDLMTWCVIFFVCWTIYAFWDDDSKPTSTDKDNKSTSGGKN